LGQVARVGSRALGRIAILVLSLCDVAFGQEESSEGMVPGISLQETAAALARSGAARNDPRVVLGAAQLLITAERASPGLRRVGPATKDSVRPEEAAKAGEFTAAGLLRLASRIAVEQQDAATARAAADLATNREVGLGDQRLAQELRQAANAVVATRGAAGGPIWSDGYLATGAVAEFKISFEGGYVPNSINVSASSYHGDLDCYLYEGSQLVSRDNGYGGDCAIRWTQRLKGAVTLRVRNTGAGTYYTILSN
jgi:hypothetical protein